MHDSPTTAESSVAVDFGSVHLHPAVMRTPPRSPSLRSSTSTSYNLLPDLPNRRQSSGRSSTTPVINIVPSSELDKSLASPLPVTSRLPSSASAPSEMIDEPLDFLDDYARVSVAFENFSLGEDHSAPRTPSRSLSPQSPMPPSATLTPAIPDATPPRDAKKLTPFINIITPTEVDTLSVRTAPPAPIRNWPSTSESHESTSFEDEVMDQLSEFGHGSGHIHSHSYSHPNRSPYEEPEYAASLPKLGQTTFSAVVHSKITEIPSSTVSPLRERKQVANRMSRIRRSPNGMVDLSQSVGYGDLEVLVQDAVLLEQILEQGNAPQEQRATARQFLETSPKLSRHPDRNSLEKKAKSSSKKGEHRYRPFFHRALSSPSATKAVRSRSIDAVREGNISVSDQPLTAVPFDRDTDRLADLPTKSSRRYFSTIRKLAATSSVVPAIFPRKSHSTSSDRSSEESTSVATPPDRENSSVWRRNRSVSSSTLAGSSMSVELSPKKALGRASTFADKLWKRARTSSIASRSDASGMSLSSTP